MVCGQFVWSSCLDCQHVAQKKINLCCEGEWKVCVCLLNKSSTVEQHIFSIEAKANWFVEYYSLFQCAICKRALQTLQFNTAVAEVFLRWPVYNYSVVMRLNFNPPLIFWYYIWVWLINLIFFFKCTSETLQPCWNQGANPTEQSCNILGF